MKTLPRCFVEPLLLGATNCLCSLLLAISCSDKLGPRPDEPVQNLQIQLMKTYDQPVLLEVVPGSPQNFSFVNWSASTFCSLGRHFKLSDNRALASDDDSCMFTAINGHLVVDLFDDSASFDWLSVPAVSARSKVFLSRLGASQPNTWSAKYGPMMPSTPLLSMPIESCRHS